MDNLLELSSFERKVVVCAASGLVVRPCVFLLFGYCYSTCTFVNSYSVRVCLPLDHLQPANYIIGFIKNKQRLKAKVGETYPFEGTSPLLNGRITRVEQSRQAGGEKKNKVRSAFPISHFWRYSNLSFFGTYLLLCDLFFEIHYSATFLSPSLRRFLQLSPTPRTPSSFQPPTPLQHIPCLYFLFSTPFFFIKQQRFGRQNHPLRYHGCDRTPPASATAHHDSPQDVF